MCGVSCELPWMCLSTKRSRISWVSWQQRLEEELWGLECSGQPPSSGCFHLKRLKDLTSFGLGLKNKFIVQQSAVLWRAFSVTNQVPRRLGCLLLCPLKSEARQSPLNSRCNSQKTPKVCLKLRCFHLKSQYKTYMEFWKWQKIIFGDLAVISAVSFLSYGRILFVDMLHVNCIFLIDE